MGLIVLVGDFLCYTVTFNRCYGNCCTRNIAGSAMGFATILRISFVFVLFYYLNFGDFDLGLSRGKGLSPGELRGRS